MKYCSWLNPDEEKSFDIKITSEVNFKLYIISSLINKLYNLSTTSSILFSFIGSITTWVISRIGWENDDNFISILVSGSVPWQILTDTEFIWCFVLPEFKIWLRISKDLFISLISPSEKDNNLIDLSLLTELSIISK